MEGSTVTELDAGALEESSSQGSARPSLSPSIGTGASRQPAYGLGIVVSIGVAAALLILAILAIGDPEGSGAPLFQTTSGIFWGLAVVVLIGVAAGAQYAEQSAARAAAAVGHPRPSNAMATAWTVPFVGTLAAILLVATYHNQALLVAGPAIAFLSTAGALFSRDLLDDVDESSLRTATTIHTLIIHAVAFLALSGVYLNKLSSWMAAPLVGIIATLLILETLERGTIGPGRRVFYALLGGAAVAESMIALNWWPTHGWTGGAVLLICFYLAAGVLLARSQRSSVRSRDLVEFGVVSAVALLFLAATA